MAGFKDKEAIKEEKESLRSAHKSLSEAKGTNPSQFVQEKKRINRETI